MIGNVNLKNGLGTQTFDSHIEFPDGTFEGIITIKGTFAVVPDNPATPLSGYMVPLNAFQQGIWHGTGVYQGWTLQLEYELTNGHAPTTLIGSLLIP
jgi:hypothetical protein